MIVHLKKIYIKSENEGGIETMKVVLKKIKSESGGGVEK